MQPSPLRTTGLFLLGWTALYLFLPVGWVSGMVSFASNPVGAALWTNAAFSVFLVHVILVSPITTFVYPQLSPRWKSNGMRVARVLLVLILLLPPLSAFAYFLDGVKQLADLHELLLVVSLSVAMGTLLYETTRKAWIFSLFLWMTTAFSFFFMNDVLNSMTTVWSYLSQGGWFYFWRVTLTVAGFMAFVFAYAKFYTHDSWQERVANWSFAFVVLGLYTLSVKILVPVLFAAFSGNADVNPVFDYWWLLYFIAVFFCRAPSRIGYVLLSALAATRGATVLWEIVVSYLNMKSGFWELSLLANQLVVFCVMLWFGYVLIRPSTREIFFKGSPGTR